MLQPVYSTSVLGSKKIGGYRFCTSEIAEAMLRDGSIKVGSPIEYWKPDGILGGRSDQLEARRFWSPPAGELSEYATRRMHENIPGWKSGHPMAKIRIQEGARFRVQSSCYIFCFSTLLGGTIVRRMASTFGYDACVWISDLVEFGSRLSNAVARLSEFSQPDWPAGRFLIGGVKYKNIPNEASEYPDVDLFEKSPPYRWQREGRIIWRGKWSTEPIIQHVPGIRELLKPVDLTPFALAPASTKG